MYESAVCQGAGFVLFSCRNVFLRTGTSRLDSVDSRAAIDCRGIFLSCAFVVVFVSPLEGGSYRPERSCVRLRREPCIRLRGGMSMLDRVAHSPRDLCC